jgi:hypothetical protein
MVALRPNPSLKGTPTADHQTRTGGTLYIFTGIAFAVVWESGRDSAPSGALLGIIITAAIISLPGLVGVILTAIPVCEITVQGERRR